MLRAPARGGLYIVDKLASELDEFVLTAIDNKPASLIPVALPTTSDPGEPISESQPEVNIDPDTQQLPEIQSESPLGSNTAAVPKKYNLYNL